MTLYPLTRSTLGQQWAKTRAYAVDAALRGERRQGVELDVLDAIEHRSTFSELLGVKWSQVQILSARRRDQHLCAGHSFLCPLRAHDKRPEARLDTAVSWAGSSGSSAADTKALALA